jgi:Tol biopolymer transport system component
VDLPLRAIAAPSTGRIGRLVLVGILLAGLVGLAVAFAGSRQRLPAPFGPAANGHLLSSSDGDIFISASPTAARRLLVGGPTADDGAWHSHDGTRFVFWRTVEPNRQLLMLANADGTGIRQLVDAALNDADWFEWSPDDTRLAIVHGVGGRRVLSVIDVASTAMTQLTVPGDVENDVLWLPPNGARLVFTARPSARLSTGAVVYSIRPDGTDLRQLLGPRTEEYPYRGIDLSPDGRTLAYWRYEAVGESFEAQARIHLFDLATGQDRVMRFDPTADGESQLRFAPDGRSAVIVRHDSGVQLMIVSLDGASPARRVGPEYTGREQLTTLFSPDGTKYLLAFEAPQQPILVDLGTGGSTPLRELSNSYASWQRLAP